MDEADQAERQEARQREAAIAQARARATLTLPRRETCLNCDAPTQGGARWCDRDCRDDYLRARAQGTRIEDAT